jgi:hypothetical protein
MSSKIIDPQMQMVIKNEKFAFKRVRLKTKLLIFSTCREKISSPEIIT